ncbi:ribonuclease H-like domain-containing protein [Tanacetum coccineum]|uniref:Ribonuclease H-like domain-containing protein n=1 Tax=Tanacetum coccineum TaxID=301880 RepID=A0ABQ5CH43_9ASTR
MYTTAEAKAIDSAKLWEKGKMAINSLTCRISRPTVDALAYELGTILFLQINQEVEGQPCTNVQMDLFGPTFVKSLNKKMYCLVVTDDFSRCDNGTEFKNNEMNQFCQMKGIKREFSVARTPQQNRVAERKNRTLIEAARTMLADSLLPTTFWAEAINTTCYVQNRVLVTKPHNKTPYELLIGIETNDNEGQAGQEKAADHEYILLPFFTSDSTSTQSSDDKDADEVPGKGDEGVNKVSGSDDQERTDSSTQDINTAGPSINTASTNINTGSLNINTVSPNDPNMPSLEETGIFDGAYDDEDVGAEADLNNLETTMNVSPIPTTRIHKDHPKDQIIGDLNLSTQTRRMINFSKENAMVSYISKQRRTNHKDYQNCLFACFLSQNEPKKVIQALTDPSWIEAMQEELLQFKLQKVWTLVDLPKGKRAIGTKSNSSLKRVYKVEKALYGLHQATRAWYETLSTYLLENGYRRGTIDKTFFIKKDRDNAQEIPNEFYGGTHFLLRLQPDLSLAVYMRVQGSTLHQRTSTLHAVKRIFRYLKGQPKLGLWYPRDSPFDFEAFYDSDYAGASLERKSITGDETVYKMGRQNRKGLPLLLLD